MKTTPSVLILLLSTYSFSSPAICVAIALIAGQPMFVLCLKTPYVVKSKYLRFLYDYADNLKASMLNQLYAFIMAVVTQRQMSQTALPNIDFISNPLCDVITTFLKYIFTESKHPKSMEAAYYEQTASCSDTVLFFLTAIQKQNLEMWQVLCDRIDF